MSMAEDLALLADLHTRGRLSDAEYEQAKARVLAGQSSGVTSGDPLIAGMNSFRRSRRDRWISGVCGGLADVTGMPSWLWRLFFILFGLCVGGGVVLYLLLWVLVPEE